MPAPQPHVEEDAMKLWLTVSIPSDIFKGGVDGTNPI